MIHTTNPATGVTLRTFEPLTSEALNARITLAEVASRTYPRTSLDERAFWMRRLALLLEEDVDDLALLITTEMGKTLKSARAEVLKCATTCRYYAENARRILAPEAIDAGHPEGDPEKDSYVRYDPLGVVLAVMPWNFPLWQVFRFLAPALMGGNVGLLKHAPNVPQCALAIEALTRRAGFPRGVFQALLIETHQVEHVLADERVAAVTLTGSEAAGRAVAAQAGWLIKKTVLELGGSDPFLVLPSADLAAAVKTAVTSRTLNCGQSCIAAKRFLIHASIYDEFESRFAAAMAALTVGDPLDDATDLGPLCSPQALRKLADQVASATTSGGRIVTGGRHISGDGHYFQPTVIADIPRSAQINREEFFGPVALLFRVDSLDDAIDLANDTPFGLAATAFTSNPHEQQRLAAELKCGAVFFNTLVASDPRLPFGGIKKSGYGRELGAAGMHEFLNAKTIVIEGVQPSAQASLFDEKTFVAPTLAPAPIIEPTPVPEPKPEPELIPAPEPEPLPEPEHQPEPEPASTPEPEPVSAMAPTHIEPEPHHEDPLDPALIDAAIFTAQAPKPKPAPPVDHRALIPPPPRFTPNTPPPSAEDKDNDDEPPPRPRPGSILGLY